MAQCVIYIFVGLRFTFFCRHVGLKYLSLLPQTHMEKPQCNIKEQQDVNKLSSSQVVCCMAHTDMIPFKHKYKCDMRFANCAGTHGLLQSN